RNNVEYRLAEVQRISDTLFGSLPFQRALQKRGDRLTMYYTMIDDVFPQLQAPLDLYGSPIQLTLFTVNPDMGETSVDSVEEAITRSQYFVKSVDSLKNSEWFRMLDLQRYDNRWLQIGNDKQMGNVSHFRKLVS